MSCLGQPDSNATEHPCELSAHCVYDAENGESNCEAGYTWEDPSDSTNYNCVSHDNCVPTTCIEAEVTCGSIADGCGGTLECGAPCVDSVCGNGVIENSETCDDGNTADGDYCSADCQTTTGSCGDPRGGDEYLGRDPGASAAALQRGDDGGCQAAIRAAGDDAYGAA